MSYTPAELIQARGRKLQLEINTFIGSIPQRKELA
jgi:hypothetical protein